MNNKLRNLVNKLSRDQRGLSTVEYVVLLVLIVVMAVALWNVFGNTLSDKLLESATEFDQEVSTDVQGTEETTTQGGRHVGRAATARGQQ